jgi:phage gp29-like protein
MRTIALSAANRDKRGRFATSAKLKKPIGNGKVPASVSLALARILRPQAAYRWMLPQLAAITPQYIENVLRGALAGSHLQAWELFDLMEDTWPRLAKNLNELKNGVRNMKATFEAYCESEDDDPTPSADEKLQVVQAALRNMRPRADADENSSEDTVLDILDAWAKGTSVLEIDWHIADGPSGPFIGPRCTWWVHPVCYAWSATGILGLRTDLDQGRGLTTYGTPPNVTEFPPDKFLIAIRKQKSGIALGGALLRPLVWWWLAANFSADWLLNLAQVFGLPFRWANYDPNAPQATVDAICNMLQNMGSAGWAAFPAGTTLELKEPTRSAGAMPQNDMLDRADKNCDLLILGQTLTSDTAGGSTDKGGGSYALGKVHSGVRSDIIDACAHFAADIYNQQLIPAILRLNYGDDSEAPKVKFETEKEEDLMQKSEIIRNLAPSAGAAIPLKYINDTFNIPEPEEGEETLAPPAPVAGIGDPGSPEKTPNAQRPTPNAQDKEEEDNPVASKLAALSKIEDDAVFASELAKLAGELT